MKRIDNILYDPYYKKFYAKVGGNLIEITGSKSTTGGNGVTAVDSLPASGEAGRIYYNTTDGEYYVYTDEGFTKLSSSTIEIVQGDDLVPHVNSNTESNDAENTNASPDVIDELVPVNSYDIEPDKLYLFGDLTTALGLHLTKRSNTEALCYYGRFTAHTVANDTFIFGVDGADIPDNIIDIEDGHTYEFNIMHGIVLLTDITVTNS